MSLGRFVKVGQLRLHVLDWGGGDCPPLFLLHGVGSSCHMFEWIAEPLTQRYRVFAVDQRGHGLSDKPSSGYDFETIAQDIDLLAEALGYGDQPLTLAGHSWGAYTALYYAATRPARTTKVALLDGGIRPLRDLFPTWAVAEIAMAPPLYVNMNLDDIKQFIRRWQGAGYRPETEALALTIFDQSDPNNMQALLSRDNNMQIAHALWSFEPADYFSRVRCPVLIVIAVEPGQTITPQMRSHAEQAEKSLANGKVVWMFDTIHDIPWHRPEELGTVLAEFL
jgi:pimeloyl-ACP methyl ester carboxylesterase